MVTEGPAEVLQDRRSEREVLERLLDGVRGVQSRVLVVCGEPGVGKTALVESAIGSASEFRVLRAVGVQSEMELAFAALQQLCAPMLAIQVDSPFSPWHSATARDGNTAVVDTELCVRGLGGLRVADASVMPSIVSGNAMASVYGIAERAARLMRNESVSLLLRDASGVGSISPMEG
jgi:choline dehydrogenase-like flavoprotein